MIFFRSTHHMDWENFGSLTINTTILNTRTTLGFDEAYVLLDYIENTATIPEF
jgi:hypothetical protein